MIGFLIILTVFSAYSSDLDLLFKKFDKDKDKKITIEDNVPPQEKFVWNGKTIQGTYHLSNLAQDLKLQELTGKKPEIKYIFENPVERISRSIRERYWDGLTRRIDMDTLASVIEDPKTRAKKNYLYIPASDEIAFLYYKQFKLKNIEVIRLNGKVDEDKHGLLSLAIKDGKGVPYVVPGGRFNEMYGWDSYFHTLGVLIDERIDLALGMVENFIYEINYYGKILNANRTYYLTRSQPPFFTSMIRAVQDKKPQSREWMEKALLAAIKEYKTIWMGKERLVEIGLSRYAGFAPGIPPEVEPGHYDQILKPFAKKHNISVKQLIKEFNKGKYQDPELVNFFYQDRAVRESGHDTTYRWRVNGVDRASDFVTIDLNSLLYKYETDIAYILKHYFKGELNEFKAVDFQLASELRKELIYKHLWDKQKKIFFDFNWKDKRLSNYVAATAFYPLWAKLVNQPDAKTLVNNLLPLLEEAGGLAATSKQSVKEYGDAANERQWDYPNGWAPHQILAWEGLINYGMEITAHRLIYKWLYMITKNAMDYNGTVPEKYNVVTRSHKVFAEYGNVGTEFSYITMEGFGWMNASYQIGLKLLPERYKDLLEKMTPPEQINFPEEK